MNQPQSFNYHTDGGHGWVAVVRSLLVELGISEKITHYSYQLGETVYLEEDCDASLFFETYKAKNGHEPVFIDKNDGRYSPIRGYPRYEVACPV